MPRWLLATVLRSRALHLAPPVWRAEDQRLAVTDRANDRSFQKPTFGHATGMTVLSHGLAAASDHSRPFADGAIKGRFGQKLPFRNRQQSCRKADVAAIFMRTDGQVWR